MIKVAHYDYERSLTELAGTIPEDVKSICVSVDNGRIYISINDVEVYRDYSLTDGYVTITREL